MSTQTTNICPGCDKESDSGGQVCWNCFKYRTDITPFKYFDGSLEEWLARIPKAAADLGPTIEIYRSNGNWQNTEPLNYFGDRVTVRKKEIIIKQKIINGETYTYAEPAKPGSWAFGGNLLYSSNGVAWPQSEPVKLHDRNMRLE